MAQETVHRDSFILRVWREGREQTWKGWVQHAGSGASAPLSTPLDLLAFIERHTGCTVKPGQLQGKKPGLK